MISALPLMHIVINEAARKKNDSLSVDDAARFVSQECKQALQAAPLWYNSNSRIQAFASHPKSTRYQSPLVVLIDYVLPNWKDYPPRSTSFTLTPRPIFNTVHRAFPIDGAQLVLVPSMYFGEAFKHAFDELTIGGVTAFDEILEVIYDIFDAWSKRKEGKGISARITSNQANQFFMNAQELLNNWQNHELMIDRASQSLDYPVDVSGKAKYVLLKLIEKGNGELLKGLNRLFDPEINGFQLSSISEFNNMHNGEIWTDAPCVMVRNDVLGDIK